MSDLALQVVHLVFIYFFEHLQQLNLRTVSLFWRCDSFLLSLKFYRFFVSRTLSLYYSFFVIVLLKYFDTVLKCNKRQLHFNKFNFLLFLFFFENKIWNRKKNILICKFSYQLSENYFFFQLKLGEKDWRIIMMIYEIDYLESF